MGRQNNELDLVLCLEHEIHDQRNYAGLCIVQVAFDDEGEINTRALPQVIFEVRSTLLRTRTRENSSIARLKAFCVFTYE